MSKRLKLQISKKKSIAILVLGDIGRSPRMQRHTSSFLKNLNSNFNVHLIGYHRSKLMQDLVQFTTNTNRLHIHSISPIIYHPTYIPQSLSFIIYALIKIMSECFALFKIFFLIPNLHTILVQNPPSIPTFFISKLVAILCGCYFIIDWHNFGFTLLALRIPSNSHMFIFVTFYKLIEKYIGRTADIHLTVTQQMKHFLHKEWKFNSQIIHVLYDRPTEIFLDKMPFIDNELWIDIKKCWNMKTQYSSLNECKGKNMWMISSTSWTIDEDISMLVDANVLQMVDNQIQCKMENMFIESNVNNVSENAYVLPKIVIFITGKANANNKLKIKFEEKLKHLELKHIECILLWLEKYENYVHLLRKCDFGLCFHNSSSTLDLPMKIVDLFGVGKPVICINFDKRKLRDIMQCSDSDDSGCCVKTALHELVTDERGYIFNNSNELCEQILCVYEDFVFNNHRKINEFRSNIEIFRNVSWQMDWCTVMKQAIPVLFHEYVVETSRSSSN